MRLIDADDFFNRLNNDTDLCAEMEFEGLKALKKYLDLQPTAYSVDKVVEELEKEKIKKPWDYEDRMYNCAICDAIETVKQGGLSDDVCECRQTSTAKYSTSCGYRLEEYFDTNACYCKQCGKKIKVVD